MNNFRIITIDGRMQTADAAPEIDLTAQRIALRKMLHGEVAFHDDPHTGQDLADAIPAAIEHAAACVGPDGVAKFFEGYIPEQAKGAQPVAWLGRASGHLYRVIDGGVACKDRDGPEWISLFLESEIRASASFEPLCPGDPRLVEWGLASADVKQSNVAAQASNETTAAQEQSQVSATPDSEGWIAHTPGECPVAPDVRVDVKLANGTVCQDCKAAWAVWDQLPGFVLITHYRPHKAELAPGVYLTQVDGLCGSSFSKWDGIRWRSHSGSARGAAHSESSSRFQARTVIRPATAQELGQ